MTRITERGQSRAAAGIFQCTVALGINHSIGLQSCLCLYCTATSYSAGTACCPFSSGQFAAEEQISRANTTPSQTVLFDVSERAINHPSNTMHRLTADG